MNYINDEVMKAAAKLIKEGKAQEAKGNFEHAKIFYKASKSMIADLLAPKFILTDTEDYSANEYRLNENQTGGYGRQDN